MIVRFFVLFHFEYQFTIFIYLLVFFSLAKSGLQLDTLDEDRLRKIKQLEAYERPTVQEAELEPQKPVFLTPLNK